MRAVYDFRVTNFNEVNFESSDALAAMYKLSPCVWSEGGRYEMLLRVVNRSAIASEKIARIHYGTSDDGVNFELEDNPVIAPGPDVPDSYDSGGCEDPTLAHVDGIYYVYYSGWNEHLKRGELLLSSGTNVHRLTKQGIALRSSERVANPKEATVVHVADGTWRLFFEYAHENKSRIGIARSNFVAGPWEVLQPLFEARPQTWDSWHLSTGPVLDSNPEYPVMFYNGATEKAQWRIGWVVFDEEYTRVIARSESPFILPHVKRNLDDTDIAFAASALENDDRTISLYYSVADQYVTRATVVRN